MPAKKSPAPYSRPRLSREAGEVALMKAAYELMAEKDVSEVTTSDIAERAGLNRAHISRYFVTRSELLAASIENDSIEAFNAVDEARKKDPTRTYDLFGAEAERLRLRNKVVAYLISIGVPQSRFHESQRLLTERLSQYMANNALSERTNKVLANMSAFLMMSYQSFSELQETDEQDRNDALVLMAMLPSVLGPVEEKLGWVKDSKSK